MRSPSSSMEIKTVVAVIIIIGLFNTSDTSPVKQQSICNPSLEDQNLAHPTDCSKYFRCVYGRSVPKECPEKMRFNPSIGNCDLYYNVECPSQYDPPEHLKEAIEQLTGRNFKQQSTVDDDTVNYDGLATGKVFETSTVRFVYLPHDTLQNAYYKIENGEKVLQFCDDGKVFSFDLEICAKG